MLSDVIELITASGAPGVTTDKLYNVGGTLFWNGTDLTAGGGGGTRIEDTATDTFVDTEFGGVNSKNLRLETGITAGNDGGTLNIVTGGPTTGSGSHDGGDMQINLGNGYYYGGGGSLIVTTGYGGYAPGGGGSGGNMNVTLGRGYSNAYGGGFFFTAGEAGPVLGGNGGGMDVNLGKGADGGGTGGTFVVNAGNGGGNGAGGTVELNAGDGNVYGGNGNGGPVRLYAGNSGSVGGNGGDVILQPGSGNTAPGDIKFEPPGGGTEVSIRVGTGVPTHSAPNGSLFLRTDGGAGTTFYVREAGAWVAK